MTKTNDELIAEYKAAYVHANGYEPKLRYERGWFRGLFTGGCYRRADIIEMTANLLARPAHGSRDQ